MNPQTPDKLEEIIDKAHTPYDYSSRKLIRQACLEWAAVENKERLKDLHSKDSHRIDIPTMGGLLAYLNYQYPPTKGNLALELFCREVAAINQQRNGHTFESVQKLWEDAVTYQETVLRPQLNESLSKSEICLSEYKSCVETNNRLYKESREAQQQLTTAQARIKQLEDSIDKK